MRRTFFLPLFLLLFLGALPARAATGGWAEVYDFATDAFPTMQVGLDVYDENGNVLPGLKAEQLTVYEDGLSRPVLSLTELQPGVRFVLALNLGPEFARRDAYGVSRYAKIAALLTEWAVIQQDASQDDISVVTNADHAITHPETLQDLRDFLVSFQPPLQQLAPTLDVLARALAAANDPLPQAGMKRVVLFVTSVPSSREESVVLQDLARQASALHIRVHVWIAGSAAYFATSRATVLKDLALQTGGQFATFSGQEPLPDPETYLAPLRRTYRLQYASAITASGSHTLTITVLHQEQVYTTAPLSFNLNVQPPNPFLVSPPIQIVRQCPQVGQCDPSLLTPSLQELEIIVEFPDGHPRPLIRTVLYVDGQAVDQNTEEPWNTFSWDLSGYEATAQHLLQVEAMDVLGLSQISAATPVTVIVAQPPAGWLRRHLGWVIGAVVFVAGLVLTIALSGIRPSQLRRRRSPRAASDVLTQPVSSARQPGRAARKSWRHVPAVLVRVNEDGQPMTATPIPLGGEVTFGSDPVKAEIVLNDPSVSPRHARIFPRGDSFYIQDEQSVSGTWVNFEKIEHPCLLRHGDLIHLGRYIYRFTLRHPLPQLHPRHFPIDS